MTFEDFFPFILPSAPQAPEGLIVQHVRNAAREFCARTLVFQFTCPTILSAADVSDYTLQIREDQELVRVLACEVNETPYGVPDGVSGRRMARRNTGNLCTMLGAQDFRLSPAPNAAGAEIILDVAVKPSLTATEWPDDFAEHVDWIAKGALGSLLTMPGNDVPWKDQVGGADMRTQFQQRIGIVAWKVKKGLGTNRRPGAVRF